MKVAHQNLFALLGHLQRATAYTKTEIERTNRRLVIRRAKKRMNVINDALIKTCITRYNNGSYTRLQFLRAVSHNVGEHSSAISDVRLDSDSESEDERADQPAVAAPPQDDRNDDGSTASTAAETCDVCLVNERNPYIALVPCGHHRFCDFCATTVELQRRGCPICRTPITMILRLF